MFYDELIGESEDKIIFDLFNLLINTKRECRPDFANFIIVYGFELSKYSFSAYNVLFPTCSTCEIAIFTPETLVISCSIIYCALII